MHLMETVAWYYGMRGMSEALIARKRSCHLSALPWVNTDAPALYLCSARTIKPSRNGDVASVLCLVFGSKRTGGDGEELGEDWPSWEGRKGDMCVWCECVGGLSWAQ
jgi:hypothetical protein